MILDPAKPSLIVPPAEPVLQRWNRKGTVPAMIGGPIHQLNSTSGAINTFVIVKPPRASFVPTFVPSSGSIARLSGSSQTPFRVTVLWKHDSNSVLSGLLYEKSVKDSRSELAISN
ncbi:OLC1v1029016C1 [Oldenlandia corymbosa var. corymbosa]|uniref:OLC1v1029016C1 n=1 Tax=Oldenlandia corymbosa var. corymbosa TaxID=529605 RepID=A0AAV1CFX6_OLDCO|nr:OLC1v1029016C1 [Oldenlandia corymbosa var. corymbosa]